MKGSAFAPGLTALPKTTHLGTYSWRIRRDSDRALLTGLVKALRPLGLATGEAGFNCDFHAIRHHGDQAVLEKHYVPRRSQRTRAVLTFFAQDHATADMVYSNAGITKAGQPGRSSPSRTTGSRPLAAIPACWSSIPAHYLQDPRRAVPPQASVAPPYASAARPSLPALTPCPPRSGGRRHRPVRPHRRPRLTKT